MPALCKALIARRHQKFARTPNHALLRSGFFCYRQDRAVVATEASWRSGYAEDCKSLHPGSIPGEASNKSET
ncbi:hypothetical protein MPC4_20308 [Methylocella tundrae]|uniref:Uncharacterized protein n=1 Tax=Methylocella tundrae TaxID=227605 RepID=A0A8B6M5J3_METTU|nr:hypothetical protein MPC1_1640004 [Methylocella tundrae]VTZ50098.1 hypothetical protein MPC4_20308 [Methylocella tundrae]